MDCDEALSLDGAQSLSTPLVAAVNAFCDRAEDTGDSVVVIRLHGAHPAQSWPGAVGIELVSRWEKALRRLERVQAAKIAIVAGVCSGPALEVLLTTDYRIGASDVRVAMPACDGGVWSGMAVYRIVTQCGACRVRPLVLFGAELSARRALAIGLLDETAEDPVLAGSRWAERLSRLVPAELAIRRRLILDAGAAGFEDMLGMHLAACDRTLRRGRGESADAGILP